MACLHNPTDIHQQTLLIRYPSVDSNSDDYDQAMAGMIFGEIPKFADILETVKALEETVNSY
jgi:hypothetical protein